MISEKIKEEIEKLTSLFGNEDSFRVWVDKINNGEKYVVRCSFRAEWLGRRVTFKKQRTITE